MTTAFGPDMIVYDHRLAHRGRRLNALFLSLREPANRSVMLADPTILYDRFALTETERALVAACDWDGLMRAGLSIYALGKGLPVLQTNLLRVGAELRGMDSEAFVQAQRDARKTR